MLLLLLCLCFDVFALEFADDSALVAWCREYHLHPQPDDVPAAFQFYARAGGLFEAQAQSGDVDLIFFFAALLHQGSHFEARKELYKLASHKQATDTLRKALLLALWHVASNQNHFLLRRATRFWWPRPRRELMQVETMLDRRLADQKRRSGEPSDADAADESSVADDPKAEPPIVGVLKKATDAKGLRRLWAVFHATGDRRALHQVARFAFTDDAKVDAGARATAQQSLESAFRDAKLEPAFEKLYFDLDPETQSDRAALEFLARIKASTKTEL
jgi:hypothetical protein